MFKSELSIITGSLCGLSFVISIFLISSCANDLLDKSIQQSTEIVNGFVKVHDVVQESITDTQQFCADMYVELSGHEKAQKELADFCDRADKIFDEIQRIEEGLKCLQKF